jgi:hypothetical protein
LPVLGLELHPWPVAIPTELLRLLSIKDRRIFFLNKILIFSINVWHFFFSFFYFKLFFINLDRLCVLVVRVRAYRSKSPGSISGATRSSE